MVTLHLAHGDVARLTAGANGSYLLDLTEDGQRAVVLAADAITAARGGGRAAWLRALTNDELVSLATARWGGPEPDVQAEAVRRVTTALEGIGPAVEGLRSLGVLGERGGRG